jgi:hypothetical protein
MSQKSRFKQQEAGTLVIRNTFPQLPYGTIHDPKFVVTPTGSKLLVSGWWGYCRKPVRTTRHYHHCDSIEPFFSKELCRRLYPKLDLGSHHGFWKPDPLLPAPLLFRNGISPSTTWSTYPKKLTRSFLFALIAPSPYW